MRTVPNALREASYGMGAKRLTTITRVACPRPSRVLVASLILAISRPSGRRWWWPSPPARPAARCARGTSSRAGKTMTAAMAAWPRAPTRCAARARPSPAVLRRAAAVPHHSALNLVAMCSSPVRQALLDRGKAHADGRHHADARTTTTEVVRRSWRAAAPSLGTVFQGLLLFSLIAPWRLVLLLAEVIPGAIRSVPTGGWSSCLAAVTRRGQDGLSQSIIGSLIIGAFVVVWPSRSASPRRSTSRSTPRRTDHADHRREHSEPGRRAVHRLRPPGAWRS